MIAIIEILGKKYEAEGSTPLEAISNLKFSGFARYKCLLTVGEKTIVLSAMQTQRIFAKNPTMRAVNVKNIALRF